MYYKFFSSHSILLHICFTPFTNCNFFILPQIIGHISNCHLNPCVTLCAVLLGKLPIITAIFYLAAEFLGALIGYGILVVSIKYTYLTSFELRNVIFIYYLQVVSPYNILNSTETTGVCVTGPAVGLTAWQALMIEAVTTGVLILLVCAVWDPRSGNGDCGSLKFLVMIFMTSVVVVSTCI